jgi:hypothetical protein
MSLGSEAPQATLQMHDRTPGYPPLRHPRHERLLITLTISGKFYDRDSPVDAGQNTTALWLLSTDEPTTGPIRSPLPRSDIGYCAAAPSPTTMKGAQ